MILSDHLEYVCPVRFKCKTTRGIVVITFTRVSSGTIAIEGDLKENEIKFQADAGSNPKRRTAANVLRTYGFKEA